jgi:hypothetical protein
MYNARLGRALLQLFRAQRLECCAAVSRLRIYVVACPLLHRVSLWLLCDRATLPAIVCG